MQEFNITKATLDVTIAMDINAEMIRQAGLMAHYTALAAAAERKFAHHEHVEEVTMAKVDHEVRQAANASGEKLTETQVKSRVTRDLRMAQKRADVNDARRDLAVIKGYVEALRHKRDMLMQLAFNQRSEMAGEMRVNDHGSTQRKEQGQNFMARVVRTREAAGSGELP